MRRLNNISECNEIGFPSCDNSTCYKTSSLDFNKNSSKSDVICASHCSNASSSCQIPFQCSDGSLILASQFCNNVSDCPDHSDETVDQPGFKCNNLSLKCILPQINLYDDIAQCDNGRDLCHGDDCFECLKKKLLISSSQVCDGEFDCYDLSDECLCKEYIHRGSFYKSNVLRHDCNAIFSFDSSASLSTSCGLNTLTYEKVEQSFYERNPWLASPSENNTNDFNINRSKCFAKRKIIKPSVCDDRPECSDFSDECNCKYPPSFCTDACHSYFPMGDRYCDGMEDPAWLLINNSACPRGFDEKRCPKRFYCHADGNVSIDRSKVCDGKRDCDDRSDEEGCSSSLYFIAKLYESYGEMIRDSFTRHAYWIMGFIVVIGNTFTVLFTITLLKRKRVPDGIWTQQLIILNISLADFLMGVYLIAISSFGREFSGLYSSVDLEWRSSLSCSIFGSLSVISSEASCLLMVILTAFRLRNVSNPIASLTISILPWKISICFAWLIALFVGVVPIVGFEHYFLQGASFPVKLFSGKTNFWTKHDLIAFACRYAIMTNQSMLYLNSPWQSTKTFLEANFREQLKLLSFYSETNVCIPRIFFTKRNIAWEYRLTVVSINFVSFIFVALCYVIMYILSNRKRAKLIISNKKLSKQEATMRKRIARIIATDFCCWIPICIMTYLRTTNISIPRLFFSISPAILLPINSALNPFLYSSLPDILIEKISCFRKNKSQVKVRLVSV